MKCTICGSEKITKFSEKTFLVNNLELSSVECENCETVFSYPTPTPEVLDFYYKNIFNYGFYKRLEILKKFQASSRFNTLKHLFELKSTEKWLDIGCGHGYFIEELKNHGLDSTGLDFPGEATTYAKSRNLRVLEGDLASIDSLNLSFNNISLWHTLEHFPDPKESLKSIYNLLPDGGKLIIAVPNIKSKGIIKRRQKWIWFQDPVIHIHHFSPTSLRLILEELGFKIDEILTRETWDAQYLFDGTIKYKLERLFGWILKSNKNLSFYFYEIARILTYPISLAVSKLRKDDFKNSELLVICHKAKKS